MTAPLACPFCHATGEEVAVCYDHGDTPQAGSDWFVRCYICHVETARHDTATAAISAWNRRATGEEFLEFKEALFDLRSLRQEHRDLNGGGPNWSTRNAAAWARVDELFADEDEAAWERQQEDAHG